MEALSSLHEELFTIYIYNGFFPFSCVLKTLPVPQRTPELPQLSQLVSTTFPASGEERSCGSSELFCTRSYFYALHKHTLVIAQG